MCNFLMTWHQNIFRRCTSDHVVDEVQILVFTNRRIGNIEPHRPSIKRIRLLTLPSKMETSRCSATADVKHSNDACAPLREVCHQRFRIPPMKLSTNIRDQLSFEALLERNSKIQSSRHRTSLIRLLASAA